MFIGTQIINSHEKANNSYLCNNLKILNFLTNFDETMKTTNFKLYRQLLSLIPKQRIRRGDFTLVDFFKIDFRDADFRGANFGDANFRDANFRDANFRDADFRDANFRDADFRDADMDYIINEGTFGLTLNCPEVGEFTAYKKANGVIVTLLIPKDALRSSATTYKCRASKAIVLEIDGGNMTEVMSNYDSSFKYVVGETVTVDNFDTNRWNECSTGIHFFMSKRMAENYN